VKQPMPVKTGSARKLVAKPFLAKVVTRLTPKQVAALVQLGEKGVVALLRKYDDAYYNKEAPLVEDSRYDAIREWFAETYPRNSYNASVGAPLPAKIQKEELPIMMGSLGKLRPADVAGWMRDVEKVIPQPHGWMLQPKFDGSSVLLKYVPGKTGLTLAKAWRRGNGDVGGDVTATARLVQGVRRVLNAASSVDPKGTYLVRVEVVMHRSIFDTYYGANAPKAAEDTDKLGKVYTDPRSLCNGLLNRMDAKASAVQLGRCTAIAYYIFRWNGKTWVRPTNASQEQLQLTQLGFTTGMNPTRYTAGHFKLAKWAKDGDLPMSRMLPAHSIDGNIGSLCKFDKTPTIAEIVERLNTIKRSIDVPIDGLVIQPMLNAPFQKKGDHLAKHPFFVKSIKLDAHEQDHVDTKAGVINADISKRGLLKPVLELNPPVMFGGVEVTNVTLNNFAHVVKWGLRPGRPVRIVRSGDVIPRLVAVFDKGKWMPLQLRKTTKMGDGMEASRIVALPGISDPKIAASLPKVCPACKTKLTWTKTNGKQIDLCCTNVKCPGRHGQAVVSFFRTLGIEDVAGATINDMVADGMNTVQKILRGATAERLAKLERYGEKKAKTVSVAIAGILKNKPLAKVMHASGIFSSPTFSMGETRLQAIVDGVGAGKIARESDMIIRRKLATLKGLGPSGIDLFIQKLGEWRKFYDTIKDLHTESSGPKTLKGITACFTGFRSPEMEGYIMSRGGRVAGMSKLVSVLFAASSSKKTAKADEYGIPVVTEGKAWEWLKERGG